MAGVVADRADRNRGRAGRRALRPATARRRAVAVHGAGLRVRGAGARAAGVRRPPPARAGALDPRRRPQAAAVLARGRAVLAAAATERGGFEPPNEVNPRYAISSRARSTAPAPLQARESVAAQVACQSPRGSQSCQAPPRRTGTSSPAVVTPVTATSSPPIMKSTWIEEWFRRGWSASPAVNR